MIDVGQLIEKAKYYFMIAVDFSEEKARVAKKLSGLPGRRHIWEGERSPVSSVPFLLRQNK